jgi:hypothetical protein
MFWASKYLGKFRSLSSLLEQFKVGILTWNIIRRPNPSIPDHRRSEATDRTTLLIAERQMKPNILFNIFEANTVEAGNLGQRFFDVVHAVFVIFIIFVNNFWF